MQIELKDKFGNIVDSAIVSSEDYSEISRYFWHLTSDGYAQSSEVGLMHKFIITAAGGLVVDHIDQNKLNNQRCNLRACTRKQNAQNVSKDTENSSSVFKGVSFDTKRKLFVVRCDKIYYGGFINELHAAFAYNEAAKKIYGEGALLNDVPKPNDFIPWTKKRKNTEKDINLDLPKYIYYNQGRYQIIINHKYIGSNVELSKAMDLLQAAQTTEQLNKMLIPLKNILRNENNIPIIPLGNDSALSALVDEESYYKCLEHTWSINMHGYAQSTIEGKTVTMHRFLLSTDENTVIDHINGNRLDQRLSNLRKVSFSINNANRKKVARIGTSIYVGVSFSLSKNRFVAQIIRNGVTLRQLFKDELVAAWCRDCMAKSLYPEGIILNSVEKPVGWVFDDKSKKAVYVGSEIGTPTSV